VLLRERDHENNQIWVLNRSNNCTLFVCLYLEMSSFITSGNAEGGTLIDYRLNKPFITLKSFVRKALVLQLHIL